MKILVVDDEKDMQTLFEQRFRKEIRTKEMEFVFAFSGEEALTYLTRHVHEVVLILSDINMPRINGFELRNKVFTNEQLQTKCIPYLFFTTGANKKSVIDAYAMSVQGFFIKPNTMHDLERTIKKIIEYWQECIAPSEYE